MDFESMILDVKMAKKFNPKDPRDPQKTNSSRYIYNTDVERKFWISQ